LAIVKSPSAIVSCFASKAVFICADVDGLALLLLGGLNVKASCFAVKLANSADSR